MQEPQDPEQQAKAALDSSLEAPKAEPTQPTPEAVEPKPEAVEAPKDTDPKTDQAVDDILKADSDEVLRVQDEASEQPVVMHMSRWQRFKNWNAQWWHNPKKRWISIGAIVVVLGVIAAVPFTRFMVLGLVLKSSVSVKVIDSTTGKPVSGATVKLSGVTAETQANGVASLKVNMGQGKLQVNKKYYTSSTKNALIGTGTNKLSLTLVATGRQVQVKVLNKVTGKPVAGITLAVAGGKSKTDAKGLASLVLPSSATTQATDISGNGYNKLTTQVSADGTIAKNTFSITPTGTVYFLSNLSGTIDVVKTNLDGSDRKTVLAGTGSEDRYSTSLLASRDWKYLALLAKRSGSSASVYLIDTTNGDKFSTIDEGNADFNLVGWSGDKFVYSVNRNGYSNWQPNQQALKSFDPATGRTLLLDQTQATGTSDADYARQSITDVYLVGDQVMYGKGWQGRYGTNLSGKSAELHTIAADGSGHKVVKSFSADGSSYLGLAVHLYEPQGLYMLFSYGSTNELYEYEDGKVTPTKSISADDFYNKAYSTYLLSPSGNKTFWADARDGKNVLSTGDQAGKNAKQVMGLSDYSAYGWYTDGYLLVSKSGSELSIMGPDGGTPLKISDYYKPAINYQGYGGGYGGQ